MTEQELAAIEARANAATPSPWRTGNLETWHVFGDIGNPYLAAPALGRVLLRANEHHPYDDDMAFIANARADVPALVAEVRRLREELTATRSDMVRLLEHEEARGMAKVICAIERLNYPTIDRAWLVEFLRAPGVVR